MYQIVSTEVLLNSISPEIKGCWEKKNNVSLVDTISKIEKIDAKQSTLRRKIKTCDHFSTILLPIIFIWLFTSVYLASISNNNGWPYAIIFLLLILILATLLALSSEYNQRIVNLGEERRGYSKSIGIFRDKILTFCISEPPSAFDMKYVEDVLIFSAKDILLQEMTFESQRYDESISTENLHVSSRLVTSARNILYYKQKTAYEFGTKISNKVIFVKATEELRVTHPTLFK